MDNTKLKSSPVKVKKEKKNKVAIVLPQKPQVIQQNPTSIEGMIALAITNKVDVGTMERLMAMRKELKVEKAKEDFDKAMASFQAECPTIKKTKMVKTNAGVLAYKYAPIEDIVDQVKGLIKKNGFSYSSNMAIIKDAGTTIKVSLKITHSGGHSEITEMSVPLGTKTGIMSDSQVVAAASTFAKRYAFCNAFGILTEDEDNEKAMKEKEEQKAGEVELSNEDIAKMNTAQNLDQLKVIGNALYVKLGPKFRKAINQEYTLRKEELQVKS